MIDNTPAIQNAQAKIRNYAVALLAKRDYACRELEAKLRTKFSQEIGQSGRPLETETISWLQELGYLNDEKFCAAFIRMGVAKGRGRLRIQQELRQKKLPQNMIDLSLDSAEVDWQDLALENMQRKFKRLPDDIKAKAKLVRYLQYRGFSQDEIFAALNRWRQELAD